MFTKIEKKSLDFFHVMFSRVSWRDEQNWKLSFSRIFSGNISGKYPECWKMEFLRKKMNVWGECFPKVPNVLYFIELRARGIASKGQGGGPTWILRSCRPCALKIYFNFFFACTCSGIYDTKNIDFRFIDSVCMVYTGCVT